MDRHEAIRRFVQAEMKKKVSFLYDEIKELKQESKELRNKIKLLKKRVEVLEREKTVESQVTDYGV